MRRNTRGQSTHEHLPLYLLNNTATADIHTLSLHDALPIFERQGHRNARISRPDADPEADLVAGAGREAGDRKRSEEHTSELQSQSNLVCRLLLVKEKLQDALNGMVDAVLSVVERSPSRLCR